VYAKATFLFTDDKAHSPTQVYEGLTLEVEAISQQPRLITEVQEYFDLSRIVAGARYFYRNNCDKHQFGRNF